jgi:hypothetical protein
MFQHLADFNNRFLAVPYDAGINKIGDRFRIAHAGSAGDNDRVAQASVAAVEGEIGEIEHIQHVRAMQFVLDRKPQPIGLPERRKVFEAVERNSCGAHPVLGIGPGVKTAGSRPGRVFINYMVQNLQPEMGHANVVKIRKAEYAPQIHRRKIFYNDIQLGAHIAKGFFDERQEITIYHGFDNGHSA